MQEPIQAMTNKSRLPANQSENEHNQVSTTVPPATLPENQPSSTHAHSHAAHLEEGNQQPHTKPAGDLRASSHPGARKQPNGGHGR